MGDHAKMYSIQVYKELNEWYRWEINGKLSLMSSPNVRTSSHVGHCTLIVRKYYRAYWQRSILRDFVFVHFYIPHNNICMT